MGVLSVPSVLVELCAYAAFVVAGWLVAPALGLVVLGTALWWIAQSLDGVKIRAPKVRVPKVRVPRVSVKLPWRRPGAGNEAA